MGIENLRREFSVDADGTLRRGGRRVGARGKYLRARVGNRTRMVHHIVFALVHGRWPAPGCDVDHINGDRFDNRPENLREVSRAANIQNRRTWGARPGAKRCKRTGRWIARIGLDGRKVYIGTYATAEEATAAYHFVKRQLHPAWRGPTAA